MRFREATIDFLGCRAPGLASNVARRHGIGVVGDPDHEVAILPVHLEEGARLMRQLSLDVGSAEDALQMRPALLAPHPGFQHLPQPLHVMLQLLDRLPHSGHIPADPTRPCVIRHLET